MIKHRCNAVLVDGDGGTPAGVVSKTDTMMAFYGGLPPDTPIVDIMMGPIMMCFSDDTLASAVSVMQSSGIHQLFVRGAADDIAGVISYGDIVGRVYRICRACVRTHRSPAAEDAARQALRVRDMMSAPVAAVSAVDTVAAAMDALAARRMGAVLVTGPGGVPAGVISKTDLAMAYLHGAGIDTRSGAVMSTPVAVTTPDAPVAQAIQEMLLRDIQRIFVCPAEGAPARGVLSLSDAARLRSGTCRACATSRLMADR